MDGKIWQRPVIFGMKVIYRIILIAKINIKISSQYPKPETNPLINK